MVHAFSNISLDHELILLSFAPSKRLQDGFKHLVASHVPTTQHPCLLARSVVRTTKIFNLPLSFRKDEESHVAMLVARSPVGVSVAKHRAPGLQTCGLG